MNSLVMALLTWISATGGYEMPVELPAIRAVPHQYLVETMCAGVECPIKAMYLRGDTIYLDDRLRIERDETHTSILLHELIHYVQVRSGRFPDQDCATLAAQEREAYRLQARWLMQRQLPPPLARLPRCIDSERSFVESQSPDAPKGP